MSLNRIAPQAGPEAYQTWQIAAPLSTHWRPATCQEAGCEHHANGWQVRIEGLDEQNLHLATHCGRRFRRVTVAAGETYLVFEAGQPCFRSGSHRVRLEREERFLVTGGDWRGNPRQERREHASAADWQDEMAGHLDRLHTAYERG
jgi:hypothetical protein